MDPIGSLAVYLMAALLIPWGVIFPIEAQRAPRSGQKCILRRLWSWENEVQAKPGWPAPRFWDLEPPQDALLAAAGRPLRFDGKSEFPRGQRRYHEVNRERAHGRSGA